MPPCKVRHYHEFVGFHLNYKPPAFDLKYFKIKNRVNRKLFACVFTSSARCAHCTHAVKSFYFEFKAFDFQAQVA